jgi:hypothetical protein
LSRQSNKQPHNQPQQLLFTDTSPYHQLKCCTNSPYAPRSPCIWHDLCCCCAHLALVPIITNTRALVQLPVRQPAQVAPCLHNRLLLLLLPVPTTSSFACQGQLLKQATLDEIRLTIAQPVLLLLLLLLHCCLPCSRSCWLPYITSQHNIWLQGDADSDTCYPVQRQHAGRSCPINTTYTHPAAAIPEADAAAATAGCDWFTLKLNQSPHKITFVCLRLLLAACVPRTASV